ncbi:hypothetical protein [Mesorhizobium amorphae]|uniref:hypothetical protein n=1 Tax=Mesorhizobium amorphae TaxID=71433 RepID=UPI001FEEA89A|nr:hypothetical protein [Mesorhizobium amorphae]
MAISGPVRLVGRKVEQQGDGADQSLAIPSTQHNPLAARRRREGLAPECLRRFSRQRMHEADRSAGSNRFDQQVGQHFLGFRIVAQNLDFDGTHALPCVL